MESGWGRFTGGCRLRVPEPAGLDAPSWDGGARGIQTTAAVFLTFIPENLQQPPASTSAGSVETEACPPPGDKRPRVKVMTHKCDVSALYLNLGIKVSEQSQMITE